MIKELFHNAARLARESWDNRAITWQLAYQKLIKDYKGTALGVLWTVVQPLVFVFIFWFAIEIGLRGVRNIGHDFPFILWLIPAIFAWRAISAAISSGGSSISSNAVLATKVVFPKITIPQFVIVSLFIVHVGLVLLAMLIFVLTGNLPTIYWLQLVYAIVANFIFCLVIATLLSAITAFSKDLIEFIRVIMTGLFWFSGIIWPLANLEGAIAFIIRLNPIVYIIETYRWSMIYGKWFWEYPLWSLYFWGLMLILAIATVFIWSRVSRYFADVL